VYANWNPDKESPTKSCISSGTDFWTDENCDMKLPALCQVINSKYRNLTHIKSFTKCIHDCVVRSYRTMGSIALCTHMLFQTIFAAIFKI
jgi:hypothetical protein